MVITTINPSYCSYTVNQLSYHGGPQIIAVIVKTHPARVFVGSLLLGLQALQAKWITMVHTGDLLVFKV